MAEAKAKRMHRATYAADKRNGGYNVRVAGPYATNFGGREVPVTLKDGTEKVEKLEFVIWSGKDRETGEKVALYTFQHKPRADEQVDF